MNISLNNPLVLVKVGLLGFSFEVTLENVDNVRKICLTVDLLIWAGCKEWTV